MEISSTNSLEVSGSNSTVLSGSTQSLAVVVSESINNLAHISEESLPILTNDHNLNAFFDKAAKLDTMLKVYLGRIINKTINALKADSTAEKGAVGKFMNKCIEKYNYSMSSLVEIRWAGTVYSALLQKMETQNKFPPIIQHMNWFKAFQNGLSPDQIWTVYEQGCKLSNSDLPTVEKLETVQNSMGNLCLLIF